MNPQNPIKARLVIDVLTTGRVTVNGPIADRLTCYAMLEAAKDVIRDFKPPEQPLVETAQPEQVPPLTRRSKDAIKNTGM